MCAQHCGDADADEPDADDVAGEPDGSGDGRLRVGCGELVFVIAWEESER